MKHSEVLVLKNEIVSVTGLTGFNTKIAIRRNITRMETAIKPLTEEEKEISEGIKEYRDEYNEINKKLSEGKLKVRIVGKQRIEEYDVPDAKREQQKNEIAALDLKHKEAIATYETKIKAFQKYLQETDSSFKPIMIKMSQIEEFDQAISQENLNALWPLIIDDLDKVEEEVEETETKEEETK